MSNKQKALPYIEKCTFVACGILSSDYFAILGVEEDGRDLWESTPPVHILLPMVNDLSVEESWGVYSFGESEWTFPMITCTKIDEAIIVDQNGGVYYQGLGKNKQREEMIEVDGRYMLTASLSGLKNIHGTIYIVGNFRKVLRRDGVDSWSKVSDHQMELEAIKADDLAEKKGNSYYCGFESIDGFSSDDHLYAAGDGSDVWRYEKSMNCWLPIDIGRSGLHFKSVCCAGDGQVYLGTMGGSLLKGRDDHWKLMDTEILSDSESIYDLAWFNDKLYVATQRRLYQLAENQLIPVDYGLEQGLTPRGAGHLDANAGWLMSVGNYSAAIYNGEQWKILYGASETDDETAKSIAVDVVKRV